MLGSWVALFDVAMLTARTSRTDQPHVERRPFLRRRVGHVSAPPLRQGGGNADVTEDAAEFTFEDAPRASTCRGLPRRAASRRQHAPHEPRPPSADRRVRKGRSDHDAHHDQARSRAPARATSPSPTRPRPDPTDDHAHARAHARPRTPTQHVCWRRLGSERSTRAWASTTTSGTSPLAPSSRVSPRTPASPGSATTAIARAAAAAKPSTARPATKPSLQDTSPRFPFWRTSDEDARLEASLDQAFGDAPAAADDDLLDDLVALEDEHEADASRTRGRSDDVATKFDVLAHCSELHADSGADASRRDGQAARSDARSDERKALAACRAREEAKSV